MANSAFNHSPSITIRGAGNSTNDAIVLWNGTAGDNFSNSTIIVGATTMGLAADTNLLTFSSGTLTIDGTLAATTVTGNHTSGAWTGTAVITTYGGTGLASYTAGDMFYYASGTTLTKLAKGTADQVLTMNDGATAPQWETAASAGISFSGSTANGMVTYGSSSSAAVESAITFGTQVAGVNTSVLKIEGSYLDYSNGPIQIKTTHASGYVPISFYKNDDTLLATFRPAVSDGSLTIGSLGPMFFATSDANGDANTFVRIETTGEVKVKENASSPSVTKGIAKAWCGITVAGSLETPSYNIDSVTINGTADRTIAFLVDFSSVVYAAGHAFVDLPSLAGWQYNFGAQAVDDIQIATWNESDTATNVPSLQVFFGEQV